ncbi:MAG: hypothetical protein JWQ72_3264 [Polaromonas sp.]|nr:hypothetical protein [Polaromonas sp.]
MLPKLWPALIGVIPGLCAAATASGFLTVTISLDNPNGAIPAIPATGATPAPVAAKTTSLAASGVCISQTLSEQTNSMVQVACGNGQFVNISPIPGRPFLGTHGGAFRYNFSGLTSAFGTDSPYTGGGTVTALRIYNANGRDGPLEVLVSF